MKKITYEVHGMHCAHCEKRVVDAVKAVDGVTGCVANAKKGIVQVNGDFSEDTVREAIRDLGFEL